MLAAGCLLVLGVLQEGSGGDIRSTVRDAVECGGGSIKAGGGCSPPLYKHRRDAEEDSELAVELTLSEESRPLGLRSNSSGLLEAPVRPLRGLSWPLYLRSWGSSSRYCS